MIRQFIDCYRDVIYIYIYIYIYYYDLTIYIHSQIDYIGIDVHAAKKLITRLDRIIQNWR